MTLYKILILEGVKLFFLLIYIFKYRWSGMGQACCAGESDKRMLDYSLAKTKELNPSESTIGGIKFPTTKKPKMHKLVEQLQQEAGAFTVKNHLATTNGVMSQPRQLNSEGLVYRGEWLNGTPNGKGEIFYPGGSYYTGYLTRGNADGEGRYISPEGWYYEGQLQNEQAEGEGILYHQALNYRYEGKWSGDLPNGSGRQEWIAKKITYDGEFLNGKKHGEGRYTHPTFEYNGSFNDNQFDSYGKIVYRNGDRFQGFFQKGQKHGKGTYTWKDGSEYEGNYRFNCKHGQGKYKSAEGVQWQGEWVEGKRQGIGKLILQNNKKLLGSWSKGEPIRPHPNMSHINTHSKFSVEQSKYR